MHMQGFCFVLVWFLFLPFTFTLTNTKIYLLKKTRYHYENILDTGKSLSEALLFAEHGENMLCTKIVLNVRNNLCTQHILPRFELEIFI